ncbi:sugar phosphate nucleotidyltransferase [Ferrimicrobium acidiphilum]|uniref:D-glycero-alpha-D-manno-heptose 1-phosphate guanylyltransferase n=4 Tax=Ferrimicrobium acidiphilum TaxID=121039 RepID=A0A0D8FXH3_9ACTN|nr:sugar phosphate nucleotidyltransferase [Ferrimicrobium acidiphilum]KJE77968.1 D-glycero-alpha-D-manno-heptose 1-phosphate guanylyltransferase [Ferrimicrobium acidiphilum DSM 19497]MCL5054099.1 sugar phosphate nucleotidyltransferase [Gammaproteobacteria bacterium]
MQAVIIAGGEGTRLRPLTSTTPKPMLPIANKPMIGHVVELLAAHGVTDIIVTVAYLGNAIRNYLGDGAEFGVSVRYLQEETPLGTAGAVAHARHLVRGTFLVLSGDVLTDINLGEAIQFHQYHNAKATMVLTAVDAPTEFGIVATDETGRVEQLIEKPTWGEVFTDTVNTGIYVLEPEVLDTIPTDRPVDFSSEVFPRLLADGEELFGFISEGYWADVGTFGGFFQTGRDILDGRTHTQLEGFSFQGGVMIGKDCDVDPTAKIEGPALIGNYVYLGPGTEIRPYTVLGDNARIETGSVLSGAIVFDHVFVGESCRIRGAILGRGAEIRSRSVVNDGVIIADGVYVGREAVLAPDIKIYPAKKIEPLSTVTNSIVWEAGSPRTVFGPIGISGLANIDITPELACRIAMAYGSMLPLHSVVMAARDTSRSARAIKRAMMVGFNSVGMDVEDLEVSTLPVMRHLVARSDSRAGVRVALDPQDPQGLLIHLIDETGCDLSPGDRRKVERALEREDFRRVSGSEVGDLRAYPRSFESWKAELNDRLPMRRIRRLGAKIVIDFSYGSGNLSLPQVLASLGMDILAVNSYPSTIRSITHDPHNQLQALARLVVASSAQLGLLVDPGAERITVVDDEGIAFNDAELAALLTKLVIQSDGIQEVIAPVNMPNTLENLANEAEIRFTWAGLDLNDISTRVRTSEVPAIGVGGRGLFLFSNLTSVPDAAVSLGYLLSGLEHVRQPLSRLRRAIKVPKVHVDEIPVSYAQMGYTMRELRAQAEAESHEHLIAIDGIRLSDHDRFWLVAPDQQEPLLKVWVSDEDESAATATIAKLHQQVRSIRDAAPHLG